MQAEDTTQEVFVYLDTAGQGFEEALEPGSESRYNQEEAKLVQLPSVERFINPPWNAV